MTTHQPVDARPSAYVGALERIEAAQKLKLEPGSKSKLAEPLPELYWATLAEAAVLADLARAPMDVGFAVGAHMTHRAERIEAAKSRLLDVIGKRRPTRPSMPEYREHFAEPERGRPHPVTAPFATGQRVRVIHGDWAGRTGTVAAVYQHGVPPQLDVRLDRTNPADGWATICATTDAFELADAPAPADTDGKDAN